ncbi:hypothetical protein OF83DRAFT_598475 [Amylostereum chailletii]|nr:hypothetical protein OF83DRAFT_598475 [Amylostereum chailletii]
MYRVSHWSKLRAITFVAHRSLRSIYLSNLLSSLGSETAKYVSAFHSANKPYFLSSSGADENVCATTVATLGFLSHTPKRTKSGGASPGVSKSVLPKSTDTVMSAPAYPQASACAPLPPLSLRTGGRGYVATSPGARA